MEDMEVTAEGSGLRRAFMVDSAVFSSSSAAAAYLVKVAKPAIALMFSMHPKSFCLFISFLNVQSLPFKLTNIEAAFKN